MSEKDRLLRELESDHKGKRKAGSASTPLGRTQRLSRSTSMLPPDPQPEAQHARKEELKVQFKNKKVMLFFFSLQNPSLFTLAMVKYSEKLLFKFLLETA